MPTKPPPATFKVQRPDQIVNGTSAASGVIDTLSDNQMWLFSQDVPYCNFYTQPRYVGDTPDYTILVKGRVPPFCQYMEFWFWCANAFNEASTVPARITIVSLDTGDSQSITLIAGGSETSTKTTSIRENEARWVSLKGVPDNTLLHADFSAQALKVVDNPTAAWTDVNVRIRTSVNSVQIYTGACVAVAPRGPLG